MRRSISKIFGKSLSRSGGDGTSSRQQIHPSDEEDEDDDWMQKRPKAEQPHHQQPGQPPPHQSKWPTARSPVMKPQAQDSKWPIVRSPIQQTREEVRSQAEMHPYRSLQADPEDPFDPDVIDDDNVDSVQSQMAAAREVVVRQKENACRLRKEELGEDSDEDGDPVMAATAQLAVTDSQSHPPGQQCSGEVGISPRDVFHSGASPISSSRANEVSVDQQRCLAELQQPPPESRLLTGLVMTASEAAKWLGLDGDDFEMAVSAEPELPATTISPASASRQNPRDSDDYLKRVVKRDKWLISIGGAIPSSPTDPEGEFAMCNGQASAQRNIQRKETLASRQRNKCAQAAAQGILNGGASGNPWRTAAVAVPLRDRSDCVTEESRKWIDRMQRGGPKTIGDKGLLPWQEVSTLMPSSCN